MFIWVSDLVDQRADVRDELWGMEQDLKSKREELEQLKVEASGLWNACPVVAPSISGQPSQGTSAETRAPKKKKGKQRPKRHPGLPSQEKQEYYKSYLAHLYYWDCFCATYTSHRSSSGSLCFKNVKVKNFVIHCGPHN